MPHCLIQSQSIYNWVLESNYIINKSDVEREAREREVLNLTIKKISLSVHWSWFGFERGS